MTPLLIAATVLAAYRITRLLVVDAFPPMEWVRDRAEARGGWVATLLECPWCTGFWVSAAAVAAAYLVPEVWEPVACVFALSAVVGILSEAVARWE